MQNINKNISKDQIKDMIQFGVSEIFKGENGTYTDQDIDELLNTNYFFKKSLKDENSDKLYL